MGTRIDSSSRELAVDTGQGSHTNNHNRDSQLVGDHDRAAVRARHQQFGLLMLGAVLCATAVVLNQVDTAQGMGRWLWLAVATVTSVVCLAHAQRRHGGVGADRDASPYYGIFAGVTSGAVLLTLLTVDGWILLSACFAMAVVLAFMAWIEQSTIGMTAALCVGVLCVGYGTTALNDGASVGVGTLAVGLMLVVAAFAVATIDVGIDAGGDNRVGG